MPYQQGSKEAVGEGCAVYRKAGISLYQLYTYLSWKEPHGLGNQVGQLSFYSLQVPERLRAGFLITACGILISPVGSWISLWDPDQPVGSVISLWNPEQPVGSGSAMWILSSLVGILISLWDPESACGILIRPVGSCGIPDQHVGILISLWDPVGS
eukprot:Em0011g253a